MESGISKLNNFNLCTLIITEWNSANYCSWQLVVCWFWPDLLAMHFIAFFLVCFLFPFEDWLVQTPAPLHTLAELFIK